MAKSSLLISWAILILIFTTSCQPKGRRASLILHDSVTLQLNSPPPAFCAALFYHDKGGSRLLYVDDRVRGEIRILSLDSRLETEPIPVKDTGANAIPYHFGFVVKDRDTLCLPAPGHKLYWINSAGRILRQTDFSALRKHDPALSVATSSSRFTSGAVVLGDEIFFLQKDIRRNYLAGGPSGYHFLLRYHMKSDSMELSPITLPDAFWEDGKPQMAMMMAYNRTDRQFVFASMYSDRIYLSSDGEQITRAVRSKSAAIREYFPYSPANEANGTDYFYGLCHYSYNVGLLWDPGNNIYYRFVWPGMEDLKPDQTAKVKQIMKNFHTFIIEILDTEFNTLGSYTLPAYRYNWNNYFVTGDGLFLAVDEAAQSAGPPQWKFHQFKVRFQ